MILFVCGIRERITEALFREWQFVCHFKILEKIIFMKKYPAISVIVPVYKAENYLHRCVDILLAQTLADFEILLIDDGSPDCSGEICDYYATKDRRIRTFHQKNRGVSSARNIGLDKAKGTWITFVDSDDSVDITFFDDFGLKSCEFDMYLQGYKVKRGNEIIERYGFSVTQVSAISFYDLCVEGECKNILNSPVCKLFRRDICVKSNLRFTVDISFGEDHLFVLSYLMYVKNVIVSPSISYNYYRHEGESLTTCVQPLNNLVAYAFEAHRLQILLIANRVNYNNLVVYSVKKRTYSNMIIILKNMFYNKNCNIDKYNFVRQFYRSLYKGSDGLLLYQKILWCILLYFPAFFSYSIFYILFYFYKIMFSK